MRILAIQAVAFYDDFGRPAEHMISPEGLMDLLDLSEMLGGWIKMGKGTSIDNDSIYLGIREYFHHRAKKGPYHRTGCGSHY